MPNIKLFDVADTYFVKGRGLQLVVDRPVPEKSKYRRLEDTIVVVRPDQSRQEYQATMEVAHFSFVDGPARFSFVLTIPEAMLGDIPIESQVFGSAAAADMLQGL